ncbi:hypothetical protein QJS66_12060 [Kocuria rhizophila]|nr:hypothetical protein QJS66_12060 [Kocuria rhizophila]
MLARYPTSSRVASASVAIARALRAQPGSSVVLTRPSPHWTCWCRRRSSDLWPAQRGWVSRTCSSRTTSRWSARSRTTCASCKRFASSAGSTDSVSNPRRSTPATAGGDPRAAARGRLAVRPAATPAGRTDGAGATIHVTRRCRPLERVRRGTPHGAAGRPAPGRGLQAPPSLAGAHCPAEPRGASRGSPRSAAVAYPGRPRARRRADHGWDGKVRSSRATS